MNSTIIDNQFYMNSNIQVESTYRQFAFMNEFIYSMILQIKWIQPLETWLYMNLMIMWVHVINEFTSRILREQLEHGSMYTAWIVTYNWLQQSKEKLFRQQELLLTN